MPHNCHFMIKKILQRLLFLFIKPSNYPLQQGTIKKIIFIHINKTGGTSIAQTIGSVTNKHSAIAHNVGWALKKHLTVKEVISIVGKNKFDNAYKFTVVRNPWSKVVSHYKFRVMKNHTKMQENPIPFIEWVTCTFGVNKNPFYYTNTNMFMPQVE